MDDVEFAEYTIFYHNIIKLLQFFIRYKGFEEDLIYKLVC